MNKEEIQQRILQNGKPLPLEKFEWNEETKTTNAQKEAKLAKEKLQEYQDFIIDENLEKKFKEYRLAKLDKEE